MARRAKTFLPPADELDATVVLWGKGEEFYRVHDAVYRGNEFNPSRKGNARFSPIRDADGKIIPTLYAGTSLDCALMETIFHDIPFAAGFKPLPPTPENMQFLFTLVRVLIEGRDQRYRMDFKEEQKLWNAIERIYILELGQAHNWAYGHAALAAASKT